METTRGASDLSAGEAFEVHRQMVISLFLATLLLSIIVGAGLYLSKVTALMVVAAAGALGGFVSALRRLYAFQRIFPIDFFKHWRNVDLYLVIYSMVPSLVGAIAAVVLYLIFASELISGPMFPEFAISEQDPRPDAFENFVANWKPSSPSHYAKALVWSFLAGFSERFVPDLLERFASNGRKMVDEVDTREADKA